MPDSGFLPEVPSSDAPVSQETPTYLQPDETPSAPMVAIEQTAHEAARESEAVQTAQVVVAASIPEPIQAEPVTAPVAEPVAVPQDEVAVDVQKIMEDGLEEALAAMPDDAKQRFLQKGKEIGILIADMVRQYKVEVKQVLRLLKEWLTTIPGVNKFFLEQDAKIKTDRILELEETRHVALAA